ncbi:TPA: molybdopterin-dependent oxidoreductase [Escherichia coli]
MKKKIESYQGAAGGWGAVKSVANAVRKQMDIRQDVIAMFDMNKPEGFDCPGCAWPDPKHSASFDICENGAKAIAWEVTDKQVNASFFAQNTVQSLLTWGDHELEAAGRLTQPLKYDAVSDCYKPLSWQQAFDEIGARLQSYSDPNQVEFYTSGRTSNEAAFLYQLFAREYGSNNFPDCSNMCHEPTSVGLAASIGVGKGTVLLEDFEKCDLVICIGHNPGTNHPRMLTSLRALVKRGAKMIAINPLQERGLERLDLAVHVATKLNRSHLLTARHSYILPVLGRSEIDMQKSGAQAVTVEDSMSMIHASRGVLKPAGVMLKSECAVVAGIAQATLPQSVVAWEYLVEDYDRIRNDIEAVLPEFADYNQRIRHPGGFHLINAAAERRWMTPSGKANFITSKGLLEDPSSAFNSKLVMATVRSHDQYNTTIYGMDDRYRGVFGQRDVVFMSAKQAKICRVKNGERVNLIALTPDGKRSSRRMDRLKVVIYPMADRSLVTYFPESNHMLTLDNHDPLSGIPGYKSIPVELEPSN